MNIFIDTSYYFSLLNPDDSNHKKALGLKNVYSSNNRITTYAVIGELATIGAQRFDKKTTISFIDTILKGKTNIVVESKELVMSTWQLFNQVPNKNISWVDCYSAAVIQKFKIENVLTFDQDFKQLQKLIKT